MPDEGSITVWLGRLSAGDADAAKPLWERYFGRMVALASGKMPGLKADAEDVALSAFFQFCRATGEHKFARLGGRDDLWHLLVVLTARKAIDWRKRQTAQKRGGAAGELTEDVPGSVRDPAIQAMVADQMRALFDRLDDPQLKDIAGLKLDGYSNEEIAGRLGCTVRTVCRRLAVIRDLWEGGGDADPLP